MVAAEKTPSVKAGRIRERRPSSAPPVHALAQQGQHPDHGIGDAVALHSRHNACRDAQYHGDEQGRTGQRQGGRRPLQHHGHGRFIVVVGGAEIPHQRPLQKADILDGQGVIEAHLFTEDLHFLFGGGGGDHQLHRVPGEVQDKKYDYGNAQDCDDGLPEPLE